MTDESIGEVTFTIVLSWTWRSRAQPTPQYGQIVEVDRLGRLVPGPLGPHVVLGLEHQRAGRADADAVAAVDARGIGQRRGPLGGDPGVEAAPGDRDRERVLGILAAGLDALVAEDALRVVPDVELVVHLDRLGDRRGARGLGAARRVVVAGLVAVTGAGGRRRRTAARNATRPRRSAPSSGRGRRPARRGPASERSTDEPRNSRTSFRECRTRSDSVWISIPGSTLREQAGTRTRDPVTSTTQTRQTLTGARFSR